MTQLIVGSTVAGALGVYLALPQIPTRGERVRRGVGAAIALTAAILLVAVLPRLSGSPDTPRGDWVSDRLRDVLLLAGVLGTGAAVVASRDHCTEPLLACLTLALVSGSLVAVMTTLFTEEIPVRIAAAELESPSRRGTWMFPSIPDAVGDASYRPVVFQQSLIAASLICSLGLAGLTMRRGRRGALCGLAVAALGAMHLLVTFGRLHQVPPADVAWGALLAVMPLLVSAGVTWWMPPRFSS